MPPEPKKKPCTNFVKNQDTYVVEQCPGSGGDRCSNKGNHISPMKTGFCSNGACEGAVKKSYSGKVMKPCDFWLTCPCECHRLYDTMFREAGMPRHFVDNSGYSPEKSDFWMPSLEERAASAVLSRVGGGNTPPVLESPAPDAVPATMARSFGPTPSGRAARGELEAWVKRACDVWLIEHDAPHCTPSYLSEEIGRTEGIKPPSVGAISAVFDRWQRIGFAEIEKKPTRFVKYTELGVAKGLEQMKEEFKIREASQRASTARGV